MEKDRYRKSLCVSGEMQAVGEARRQSQILKGNFVAVVREKRLIFVLTVLESHCSYVTGLYFLSWSISNVVVKLEPVYKWED